MGAQLPLPGTEPPRVKPVAPPKLVVASASAEPAHRHVEWGEHGNEPSPEPQRGRIYHPFHKWEDAAAGMWRNVSSDERVALREAARTFMDDTAKFREFMFRVVVQWTFACEVNLSAKAYNRQAWIGHAATVMATTAPEDVTRQAWHELSREKQNAANAAADEAIIAWESANGRESHA